MKSDRLTLEQAKAEIQEMKRQNSGHCMVSLILRNALNILARVEQPSEEDRAVLWLMKEKGWEMARTAKGIWSMDGTPIASPAEEAKKLGWGGGE